MLTVYKASAGSGKTYQLVAAYLKLLLKDPMNYKHILAVTFTNKATNEMKSRILGQLHLIATNNPSDYIEELQKDTSFSEDFIRKRARQVLKNILHDYNRFSISTIDAFTQRIIKAFNREIGISPRFTLELNDDLLLEEAADRLLGKVGTDKQLRKWLVEFSKEKIRENKSQQIEEDIKSLGKELFNEKFQLFFPENENTLYTRENLEAFRGELNKIIAWYEGTLRKIAREGMETMHRKGFSTDDFSFKRNGIAGFFKSLSEGVIKDPGKRVLTAGDSPEKWIPAKHPRRNELTTLVEKQLHPLLTEILSFIRQNETRYVSALEVRKQLRMLGILADLKEEISSLLQEKGVLQLSGSNLLLSKIIGSSDSPFIYEKIGNQFKHFMLDEFQDTSMLQWNNFKPLVANSLSEGHANLLVGDVKQSVYRWRNSDWNILAEKINTDFPHFQPHEKKLDKNWRSHGNIIDFNNAAFSALKKTFELLLTEEIKNDTFKHKLNTIYAHFRQESGKPASSKKGLVKINFPEEENFEENSSRLLVEQVKQLQDQGLKASGIAILIRKNREGTKIIETFLAESKKKENDRYNLSVISSESLFLHASRGVNFVIFMIEWLIDPEDRITQTALLHLWFSWLKPELAKTGFPGDENNDPPAFSADPTQHPGNDFETIFEKELGTKIKRVKEKVLLASPDESIIQICSLFGLFRIPSEWPFLQTLIDQTAEIKKTLSNDLSNLLHWWNEKGFKASVNVNEQVDAIRLLTVHKSKGLEYEAVLIPYFNWEVSWRGNQAPILWCKTDTPPFNQLPLLPVKAGSSLERTIFKDDYFEEKINSFIDTLNLVYVAFTRAKSVLMVSAKKPAGKMNSKNNGMPGKSVNSLLKHALEQLKENAFAGGWNDEKTTFTYGEMPVFVPEKIPSDAVRINRYHFNDFSERIKLRMNSEDFLKPATSNRSVKNTGKLIHEILSEIITFNDIDAACNKALSEGKTDKNETKTIRGKLKNLLKKPVIKNWFDGSYTVMTERELLSPGRILRPDRIMVTGKKAVVVDYKWGEKIPGKYHAQVSRYAKTLRETGFETVEGYLLYINQDEVEQV